LGFEASVWVGFTTFVSLQIPDNSLIFRKIGIFHLRLYAAAPQALALLSTNHIMQLFGGSALVVGRVKVGGPVKVALSQWPCQSRPWPVLFEATSDPDPKPYNPAR
jgi:hypothetical protein